MDVICTFFRRSERPRTSPRSISVSRSNASCRLCLSGSAAAASYIHRSIYTYIYLPTYLPACLSIYLSIDLSIYLSI